MKRRSFSGKQSSNLSDEERKANISSILGISPSKSNSSRRVVLQGESLISIAQKIYQDPLFWRLLAIKNNLSSEVDRSGRPVVELRKGQTLKLPDSYEVASFIRNPAAPVVVALATDKRGLAKPRIRICENCHRRTLAMAVYCVSCGLDMDYIVAGEELAVIDDEEEEVCKDDREDVGNEEADEEEEWEEDEEYEEDEGVTQVIAPSVHSFEQDQTIVSRILPPDIQDQTVVTNLKQFPQDNSHTQFLTQSGQVPGQTQGPPQWQQQGQQAWQPDGQSATSDQLQASTASFWSPNPRPVFLDSSAQVIEQILDGTAQGLRVALLLQIQNQWTIVCEYDVFADDVVIIQYHRASGPKRMKKSLPSRQSRKMAWNHFRNNWQSIYNEFLSN